MAIHYQKTEHDCWICALGNFLSLLKTNISEEEALHIIQDKKNFPVFMGRGFFTYIPVVLDELNIKCDFVLDSHNPLLKGIVVSQNGVSRIHAYRLDAVIREYEQQSEALCYFYKALKLSDLSLNITLKFAAPSAKQYLDKDHIVIAALTVAELYGINGNNALHSVTLRKKQGKVEVIDPYELLGREEEENWTVWRENSYQYDWSKKLPYFIAAKSE